MSYFLKSHIYIFILNEFVEFYSMYLKKYACGYILVVMFHSLFFIILIGADSNDIFCIPSQFY